MSMEQFFTRQKASEGKRFPLTTPDGQETEHWLQIRSVWSDEFQNTKAEIMRDMMGGTTISAVEREARMVAALVADWSFPEPCTPENVTRFMLEAPQIRRAVDTEASNDRRFFTPSSNASTNGPEQKSDSPSPKDSPASPESSTSNTSGKPPGESPTT